MPEYVVDLCSIIVDAKDNVAAREKVRERIVDSGGRDVGIDQAIRMDEEG